MPTPNPLQKPADQRAHPRVAIAIAAKISIPAEGAVRDCQVVDLSVGGAGLQYAGEAPKAELVCLLTIRGFGSFEGITVRDCGDVLGVRFLCGEAERHNLQEKLIAFIEEGMSAVANSSQRGAGRSQLSLTRTNGQQQNCDVRAISLLGVTLTTPMKPPVGELVKLARMYGRVVRHDQEGVGVQFVGMVGDPGAAA